MATTPKKAVAPAPGPAKSPAASARPREVSARYLRFHFPARQPAAPLPEKPVAAGSRRKRICAEPRQHLGNVHQDAPGQVRLLRRPHPRRPHTTGRIGQGIRLLPIKQNHLRAIARLPKVAGHGDSLDFLIIAQALTESLPVLTTDRYFRDYGVRVV